MGPAARGRRCASGWMRARREAVSPASPSNLWGCPGGLTMSAGVSLRRHVRPLHRLVAGERADRPPDRRVTDVGRRDRHRDLHELVIRRPQGAQTRHDRCDHRRRCIQQLDVIHVQQLLVPDLSGVLTRSLNHRCQPERGSLGQHAPSSSGGRYTAVTVLVQTSRRSRRAGLVHSRSRGQARDGRLLPNLTSIGGGRARVHLATGIDQPQHVDQPRY